MVSVPTVHREVLATDHTVWKCPLTAPSTSLALRSSKPCLGAATMRRGQAAPFLLSPRGFGRWIYTRATGSSPSGSNTDPNTADDPFIQISRTRRRCHGDQGVPLRSHSPFPIIGKGILGCPRSRLSSRIRDQLCESCSRSLSFSITSRFSRPSTGSLEVSSREDASPFFASGTSSPALASLAVLLRSSTSLQRFMPIVLPLRR